MQKHGAAMRPPALIDASNRSPKPAASFIFFCPSRKDMTDAKGREVAESAFKRYERREAKLNDAVQQEHTKHEAEVKNMRRLRSLRLQRDAEKAAGEI
jgi:hypothetical protein